MELVLFGAGMLAMWLIDKASKSLSVSEPVELTDVEAQKIALVKQWNCGMRLAKTLFPYHTIDVPFHSVEIEHWCVQYVSGLSDIDRVRLDDILHRNKGTRKE